MTVPHEPPHRWTHGDTITSDRFNVYTDNDAWFKAHIDALEAGAPPDGDGLGDVALAMFNYRGIYWAVCCPTVDPTIVGLAWDAGYVDPDPTKYTIGTVLGEFGSATVYKLCDMVPTARHTWDVRRSMMVAIKFTRLTDVRRWVVMGGVESLGGTVNHMRHVGFIVDEKEVYASVGDGEGQTKVKVMDLAGEGERLKFGCTSWPGGANFYINDVYMTTITTSNPIGPFKSDRLFQTTIYAWGEFGGYSDVYGVRFIQVGTRDEVWEPQSGGVKEMLAHETRYIPASGTFSECPECINDNDLDSKAGARYVDEYAHIILPGWRLIKRFRHHGSDDQAGDGRWKIQYYDGWWHDWETGIPVRTTNDWSSWINVGEIKATLLRLVCTTMDTGTDLTYIKELEAKF